MVAVSNGDEVVALPSSKPATLLTAMLLRPNQPLSIEYLQHAVWGDELPDTARATLQTYVLRLRRLFAKFGIANDAIVTVPGGYQLPVSDETLDLLRFRTLMRASEHETDPEAELRLLREALVLWQGAPLSNIQSDVLHRDEVPRLTEEWLRATERRFQVALSLGRSRDVLADLRATAHAHPGHERFAALLIEALYRVGRKSEALDEYQSVRRHLAEQLGLEPGPALHRLELAILRGDEPTTQREQSPSAVTVPPARPQGDRLPGDLPDFVGRQQERNGLLDRLTGERSAPAIAVISGPPGIGKTALAVHVGHLAEASFGGGVRFVPAAEADAVGDLGADGTLLIVDDVVDIDQVEAVLPASRNNALLITSRSSLAGLAQRCGAAIHRLAPLRPAESRELLAGIVGDDRVAGEDQAAAELAGLCGQFPLALRIVGTRLLLRPRQQIVDEVARLSDDVTGRLSLCGEPDVTLTALFESYLEQLDAGDSAAFEVLAGQPAEGLSVADCCTALGRSPGATTALLDRLIDASLLDDDGSGGYRVPPLLRAFVRGRHRAGQPVHPGVPPGAPNTPRHETGLER